MSDNSHLNTIQVPTIQSIWQNEKYFKVPMINVKVNQSRATAVTHTRSNTQYN